MRQKVTVPREALNITLTVIVTVVLLIVFLAAIVWVVADITRQDLQRLKNLERDLGEVGSEDMDTARS